MYARVYMHFLYIVLYSQIYYNEYIRNWGEDMAISDARRRANDKWRDKFDEVRFRVPKGKKDLIKEHADKRGESVNAFLNRALDETVARDNDE